MWWMVFVKLSHVFLKHKFIHFTGTMYLDLGFVCKCVKLEPDWNWVRLHNNLNWRDNDRGEIV